VKAAATMGREIVRRHLVPDLVLCSNAVRARRTWELASAELRAVPPTKFLATLYLASAAAMLAIVRRQNDARRLLLVGHDPGMHDLAARLAVTGPSEQLASIALKFPTGALAVFRLEGTAWDAIQPERSELVAFVRPRDLD